MNKLNINQTIYFCDTETESLNLDCSRPWEFAWVKMENGIITDSQSRYIKWDNLKVGKEAQKKTGFNQKKYDQTAVDPQVVYDEIKDWFLGEDLLGFHNGLNFDVYIVRNWFRNIGQFQDYSWARRIVDTNALVKAWKSESKPEANFDAWQYKWINTRKRGLKSNITDVCKEWDIAIDESRTHQGDYDCYLTSQIFKKVAYFFQEV
jgi:DNA polymerase III alpha subunit (gram-positive type)